MMKKKFTLPLCIVFILFVVFYSSFVIAADEEVSEQTPQKSELASPPVGNSSADGANQEKWFIKKGFFAEGLPGAFFSLGGYTFAGDVTDPSLAQSAGISNFQPSVGIGLGYDITHFFSVTLSLSTGYSNGSYRYKEYFEENAGTPSEKYAVDSYSVMNFGVNPTVSYMLTDRIAFEGGAIIGVATISPKLYETQSINVGIGGGIGVMYYTLLTNTVIGFEVDAQYLLQSQVPTLSLLVPIRYAL